MSFTRKVLRLTFQLGTGEFGDSGATVLTVSGLRAHAQINNAGGDTMGQCHLTAFGMTQSQMNPLTALAAYDTVAKSNSLLVEAGDASGMAIVFEGTIAEGWVDLSAAPEVRLEVIAYAGLWQRVKPVAPRSYAGNADAAVIMASIAADMGLAFQNGDDVHVMLSKPYFDGTSWDQARACADAAGINWTIDKGALVIWSRNGNRSQGSVPQVSPETGLVGYPAYTGVGVGITSGFNPNIQTGGLVAVQTDVVQANGRWYVTDVSHDLASEMPDGPWFTQFNGRVPQ